MLARGCASGSHCLLRNYHYGIFPRAGSHCRSVRVGATDRRVCRVFTTSGVKRHEGRRERIRMAVAVAGAATVGSAGAASRRRKVAVIGGGPAGMTAARFLSEVGHQPIVLERGSEVGGIWAATPVNEVVYPSLVTNIPTMCMQSFDFDFPAGLTSFVTAEELGRYIVAYADRFDLRRYVTFNADVTSVHALHSEEEEAQGNARWRVRWVDKQSNTEVEDMCDAVVVCTGHYDEPYAPEVPGQSAWLSFASTPGSRTVTHSREYRGPEKFKGRSVLVVGGRSSAVDIARELRGIARWVYVIEKGCKLTPQVVESCTHVPLGGRLASDGQVHFEDGAVQGPPVDDLILATGYKYAFPFLDSQEIGLDYGDVARWVKPLYLHVVHAKKPTLCFLGIPLAVPCPIPLFEAQARYVASHLLNCNTTAEERADWVDKRVVEVGERPQDIHFLSGSTWEHMRQLVKLSGVSDLEYEAYVKRLATVQSIYEDRVRKKPQMPWDSDWYRRCEYHVDWDAAKWTVKLPEDAPASAAALGA